MSTNTSKTSEKTITIRMGISIDWLLSLPNLMDYLSFEDETTEQEARDYLQSLKDDGHEILPRPEKVSA
jgi:hypothetical protein